MGASDSSPLACLIASINRRRRLRVWSLIITFLGDAIVPRGGAVSARTVQDLLGLMGIEPGAVRTAFSRLSSDGWVEREKRGRSSFYRLSSQGFRPFEEAEQRIYATLPDQAAEGDEDWILALNEADKADIQLFRNPTSELLETLREEDWFVIEGRIKHLPDWMRARFLSPEVAQGFQNLIDDFGGLSVAEISSDEAIVIRCLLIHEWRRVVLKIPSVNASLLVSTGLQNACSALVASLYRDLFETSEAWLEVHGSAPGADGDCPLPPMDPAYGNRFG